MFQSSLKNEVTIHKKETGRSHYGDVPLDLLPALGQASLRRHGVPSFNSVDDGDIGEEHDEHRDEEARRQNGEDVRFVNRRDVCFGPVDLTGSVSSICRRMKNIIELFKQLSVM